MKYAFWKYDLFPYVLWGKLIKEKPGGFMVDGFHGWFSRDSLLFILDGKTAKRAIEELNALKQARELTNRIYIKHAIILLEAYK